MGASQSKLLVKKRLNDVMVPLCATPGAAGYDLFSPVNITIPALGRIVIDIGITVKVPNGSYGQLASHSGLAFTHSIECFSGVIDQDCTGSLTVLLKNHSNVDYEVKKGHGIAQLLLIQNITPPVIIVAVSI